MEQNSNMAEVLLVSKTGRRGATTIEKFSQKGFSVTFFICATSTLTSAGALILLTGSKALRLTQFNYLACPLAITSGALGIISDFIDGTFRWYSPLV